MTDRMPHYIDMARLCFELSIVESTAEAWVKKGILPPPINRGGKRLFRWSKVVAYLEGEAGEVPQSPVSDVERMREASRAATSKTH